MQSYDSPKITGLLKRSDNTERIRKTTETYLQYYDTKIDPDALEKKRKEEPLEAVEKYYEIATDFFEYGWGESFHFASLRKGESREHSFAKHEYALALKLHLKRNENVLDIGCGIGGPARHIASFTGANILGINISDYQLKRAKTITTEAKLDHLVRYQKENFCKLSFDSNTFDKAYAIEATCHAVDVRDPYREAYRTLKPGGLLGVYEWIMTDKYDPNNCTHKKIKEDIMIGDALPDIRTEQQIQHALKEVGFEILEMEDLSFSSEIPWYSVLCPKWTLSDIKITPVGRWLTHLMLVGMETVGFVPRGSADVHRTLCRGADGLVAGGKLEIFSPILFFLARKPLKS